MGLIIFLHFYDLKQKTNSLLLILKSYTYAPYMYH